MSVSFHGLRTVIYPATDLAASTRWWTDQLGFGPYFSEPFYVGFEVAGYELGLLPDADPADGAITYWAVDDVAASMFALIASGASLHQPATEVGDGITAGSVRSPDGSIIGLIDNPHFAG